ncbi:SDR family NAD(P)-dependent oxidoreductase [Gulosibacter molinativorax]|uniref:SDR family oxidoreductase n=1 Tax=Gulosibacter molinativorax TaxID=256821 RepID=A0ABT7C7H3_9MICO|nr:SDR family oxidoreductase [Gulosibacter molinativorax]MDJ1371156.1 SDR family oxidoreductase [Gulosibacter molinativorax]QUY62972.1 3-alpha-(Or 20-beta)-hydroxysteroid dehydrogenase [Gulosibacter molinativorax]
MAGTVPTLEGKVALISGGARGMGAAEAKLLADRGAKVVIGATDGDRARAAAAAIGRERAIGVALEVRDAGQWKAAFAAGVDAFGEVNVLVNNAGIFHQATIAETSLETYRELIEVNQIGAFLGMQTSIPHLKGGGSIINIVSISAFAPLDLTAAYASTKSALLGLSKAAVTELGPLGIRVNMVHPGGVATDMGAPGGEVPDAYSKVPLGRIGASEDIARTVAFLASDDSAYLSGAEITVDGGWTTGTPSPWG